MNNLPPSSRTTLFDPERDWALEPGLAQLAFGSRVRKRDAGAPSHLAFLSQEALQIDLSDPRQREFGDYELLEQIGQGGMGVVYRARQAGLEREVAVKLLSAGPWASPEFIARFQREAKAAARMQHPNIVAIHETGVHDELNFFSMQLVHGGSLANQLATSGPLQPRAAAELLRTVAEAVDYAHQLDVLHLDLKPGNVLIDANGKPQVADFGLARRIGELISHDRHEVSGTPSYMSPEQVQGRSDALSPATDIYGLGAVLYECLTGKPPFHARTAQATLLEVMSEPPTPPSKLAPGVPADLEAICLKCLAKEPAERYPSARALADDLSRFLEAREVLARPLGAGGRLLRLAQREPRLTSLTVLLLVSLALGFGATAVQWRRAEGNALTSSELLWESRRGEALQLEREGRGLEALPRLLANVKEQERAGVPGMAELERRRMGLVNGQSATLIDRIVVADASPLAVAVSADGKRVAVGYSDQSVRWYDSASLDERGRVQMQGRVDAEGHPAVPRLLRFVGPDRLRITLDWVANNASPADGDSWLLNLQTAQLLEPPAAFADFADATFDADGRYAILRDHQHAHQLWQVDPWRALGPLVPSSDGQFLPSLLGPQARYAVRLETGMVDLGITRPAGANASVPLPLPGSSSVSAWARSKGGGVLAIGDVEGRIYLLDTSTGKPRQLAAPLSREVTWVDFSEDDAWLAVGTRDGAAFAYNVASGEPLASGQMQNDFPLLRVELNHRQRLLVAAGRGRAALWRIPEQGPRAVPAQRVVASPLGHGQAADYAVAWSLETGLLASAGLDGDIRLWRLPLGPTAEAKAAPQVSEHLQFDGHRVVDVAWDQLRLVGMRGKPIANWKQLGAPPGFAELVDEGRTLIVTSGAALHILDAGTLHPRHPAIALEATTERLLVSGDSRWAVATHSVNVGDGVQEALQLVDLENARLVGGELRVRGPLRRLAFSGDSSRLLALGPPDDDLAVFTVPAWERIGTYAQDETQPIAWADFDANGLVVLATRAPDPRFAREVVARWDPVADQVDWQADAGQAQPLGVIAIRGGLFVAGRERDRLYPGQGPPLDLPRLAQSDSTAVLATSSDGALVAHAFVREVQLHDAATGASLGMPLATDSDANDVIVQLAFSPAGDQLLARTIQGHWRHWRIAAELRPTATIERQLSQIRSPSVASPGPVLPTTADRKDLRRNDPGAWPPLVQRPQPAVVRGYLVEVPHRPAGMPDSLVDLSPVYNFTLDTVRNRFFNVRSMMRPIPVGRLHLGNVDFDVRGMSQIGTFGISERFEVWAAFGKLACAPMATPRMAAVHLLLQVSTPSPMPTGEPLVYVQFRYMDGSEAQAPLRSGFELPGYAGADEGVTRVLAIDPSQTVVGFEDAGLATPRIANPFPERPVRCLGVATLRPDNPLVLFAMTTEPVQSGVGQAAVIGAADFRTGKSADATNPKTALVGLPRPSNQEAP